MAGLSVLPGAAFANKDSASKQDRSTHSSTGQTLLLVDDHHILYRSGTKRILHPLTRHPGNPLIQGRQQPWETAIAWNSVYRNPVTGLFQLWYQAFAGDAARERTHRCTVCYAESQDGITWTKPNLGLHSFNDIKETNIVLLANGGTSDRYGASVIFDPLASDQARRYKMVYFDFTRDSNGHDQPGLTVAFSPDGIHWTKHPRAPLLPASYGTIGETVPFRNEPGRGWTRPLSVADAQDVFYDPKHQAFVRYGKMWIDGPDGKMFWKHAMGRTQSPDFIHWSRPQLVLAPDDIDPSYVEFHTVPVFFHQDCYFACPQILNRAERGGVMDIELAFSRDGFHWERPFRHPFFLARNTAGQFDSGSLFTSSTPVFLENEIRFYYGGYSDGATGGDDYNMASGIGLATMPRDRFAGIWPQEKIGQVTLKPIDFRKCETLLLNADANSGAVWCEVLEADGFRVRGFTREDAMPISGDSLRHPVRWKEKSISQLPFGSYLLRFHLENAEIFAVFMSNQT